MEVLRALGAAMEEPSPELAPLWSSLDLGPLPSAADHTALFVLDLPPFASIYLGAGGMLGGEARDRVAGFFRAIGTSPPAEVDNAATLLGTLAELHGLGRDEARAARAYEVFLWEHVLSWLPVYCHKIRSRRGPYAGWADRTLTVLGALASDVAPSPGIGKAQAMPPLPSSLRSAPALADPRADGGADAFQSSLLAAAESGVVWSKTDLAHLGRDLGLGIRAGERRYILRHLLSQDSVRTLRWLAEASARHGYERLSAFGPITDHWQQRAEHSATLLHQLASDAAASIVAP